MIMISLKGFSQKSFTAFVILLSIVLNAYCDFLQNSCQLPEFISPYNEIKFRSRNGYPRKLIATLINMNDTIKKDIKTAARMRVHQRKVLQIFPEQPVADHLNIRHAKDMCRTHRKYGKIGKVIVDKNLGECWVLWQWRGIIITWAECDKYCDEVQSRPPFTLYLCLPGHVINFSFWLFCPKNKQFVMRTIALPQCCSCSKYSCYNTY